MMEDAEYIIKDCVQRPVIPERIETKVVFKKDITKRFGVVEILGDDYMRYPFIMSSKQIDILINALCELRMDIDHH